MQKREVSVWGPEKLVINLFREDSVGSRCETTVSKVLDMLSSETAT